MVRTTGGREELSVISARMERGSKKNQFKRPER